MIAGIRFRPQGQIYYFSASVDVAVGDAVVVKTEQGMGFGTVYFVCEHMPTDALPAPAEPGGEILQNEELKETIQESVADILSQEEAHTLQDISRVDNDDPLQKNSQHIQKLAPIIRIATQEDCIIGEENQRIAQNAFAFCKKCIAHHSLDMKLVDVEIFFDRSKFMFYFTAPARIDFRELVKDLVREYRARIELRQIGVRHETQMIGALGSCGMVCCCKRYLRKFAPVTIRMAKEQNLFLNPAKISGICGRLLCCLSYEQENYDSFYSRCPKIGKRYTSAQGSYRVLRTNMFKDSVSLITENNEEVEMTLDAWHALLPQFSERRHNHMTHNEDHTGSQAHDIHEYNDRENNERSRPSRTHAPQERKKIQPPPITADMPPVAPIDTHVHINTAQNNLNDAPHNNDAHSQKHGTHNTRSKKNTTTATHKTKRKKNRKK